MALLAGLDLGIVIGYLCSVVLVGAILTCMRRRKVSPSSMSLNDYFLGDRSLPWWALSIADLSSYLDIAGTMINTALVYSLGAQGFFIEIRGGVCLMLPFQMALTGKLVRRSTVLTRAEWMRSRFGDGAAGKAAQLATAVVALMLSTLMVAYFAIGGGKFVTEFIEFPAWLGMPPEFWGASALMGLALVRACIAARCMLRTNTKSLTRALALPLLLAHLQSYSLVSGFVGIVWTDVYQSLFIFASFAYVGAKALEVSLPDKFAVFTPGVNGTYRPIETTKDRWMSALPQESLGLPTTDVYAKYDMYWVAILFYLLKTCFGSASGPIGGGLQTVLAQRSDRDVALQTWLAALLMSLRWLFSGGLAVLAIHLTVNDGSIAIDPERVLPIVAASLPDGGRGLVVAALLAAGLTTFDTTVNSAAAYWTSDIYKTFVNPRASKRQLIAQAMLCSIGLIAAGLAVSRVLTTINAIWGTVTMTFGGATVWPMFLAWYWHRFNGWGFCAGTVAGMAAAVAASLYYKIDGGGTEYMAFVISSGGSLLVGVPVALITAATPGPSLRRFYLQIRPPGWWSPMAESLVGTRRARAIQREHGIDFASVSVAIVWQMSLYLAMMSLVFQKWEQMGYLGAAFAVCSLVLYFSWYLRLDNTTPDKARFASTSSYGSQDPRTRISVPTLGADDRLMQDPHGDYSWGDDASESSGLVN